MEFTYLGGGQNGQTSSVGQALSQKYAPLESMLEFTRGAYDRGVAEASQTMREAMRIDAEKNDAVNERRYNEKQAKIKKKELAQAQLDERNQTLEDRQSKLEDEGKRNLGFLSEWMDEQNDLIDNALKSNDPEIRSTIPALLQNLMRVKNAMETEDVATLAGRLRYNAETKNLAPSETINRSRISQRIPEAPKKAEGPKEQPKDEQKDDKKVPLPSSDVIEI